MTNRAIIRGVVYNEPKSYDIDRYITFDLLYNNVPIGCKGDYIFLAHVKQGDFIEVDGEISHDQFGIWMKVSAVRDIQTEEQTEEFILSGAL